MINNMLNLPKLIIIDMMESKDDYRFLVETSSSSPLYCPKCGTGANLYKHGRKKQLFLTYQCTLNVLALSLKGSVTNVRNVGRRSLKAYQIWMIIDLLQKG